MDTHLAISFAPQILLHLERDELNLDLLPLNYIVLSLFFIMHTVYSPQFNQLVRKRICFVCSPMCLQCTVCSVYNSYDILFYAVKAKPLITIYMTCNGKIEI